METRECLFAVLGGRATHAHSTPRRRRRRRRVRRVAAPRHFSCFERSCAAARAYRSLHSTYREPLKLHALNNNTKMSQDHSKQRRNEHLLKNLPTEVLLKARSTLFSLSGALKSKHEHQRPTKQSTKQELKEKKTHERLKSSRSEPEFSEVRKKHRSRIEEASSREYLSGVRPRPMSVGTGKLYDRDLEDFRCGSYPRDVSPMPQRNFDSSEEVCLQSRLVIPVGDRFSSNQDVHMQDANERPRKKLSFREPEIVISSDRNGSSTMGRSHKLMGVNSLTRRSNRVSLRSEPLSSSLDGLDSDLEVSRILCF